MDSSSEKAINHTEFVVLGLLCEGPSHAYSINKKIEDRGMRDWTNIGRSSIYRVLKDLERYKLLEKWIEEKDNRTLKVHQITDFGWKILKNKIYMVISEYYGKNDDDFYVAFSMLPVLTQDEQVEAFTNSLNKIRNHLMVLENKLKNEEENFKLKFNKDLPLNIKGLFIHSIKILQTNTGFLESVLENIKKGGGQVDPKAYGK